MRAELEKVLADYTVIENKTGDEIKPEVLAKLLNFHIDKVLKNYEEENKKRSPGIFS